MSYQPAITAETLRPLLDMPITETYQARGFGARLSWDTQPLMEDMLSLTVRERDLLPFVVMGYTHCGRSGVVDEGYKSDDRYREWEQSYQTREGAVRRCNAIYAEIQALLKGAT